MSWLRLLRCGAASTCILLAGCAATPEEQAPPPSVEEILSQAPAPEAYGRPQRCLRLVDYEKVDVLNDENLLFWGRRDKVWLNKLRARCVGLRPRSTLRFDVHSGSVCNLDSVSAIDSIFGIWRRTSATCGLGQFEPITVEQAEMLKAAFGR